MRRTAAVLIPALVILGGVAVASPAAAAPISYAGTTIDVVLQPSGTSTVNGGVAYLPESGGAIVATLGAPIATDVLVNFYSTGGGVFVDCTIPAGSTSCGDSIGAVAADEYAVYTSLTTNAITTPIPGTLIVVDNVAPEVSVEWQDASGAWINGDNIAVPLFQTAAGRCVITNVSNAPMAFTSFSGSIVATVPISGTLQPGETRYYPVGVISAPAIGTINCSGSVGYPDGTSNGNGNGGGIILTDGSIDVAPALAEGRTVTVTGEDFVPLLVTSFAILFDGVPVNGSPVTVTDPAVGFAIDVEVPDELAPGIHTLEVVAEFGEQDTVWASFDLEIPEPPKPALAATGSEPLVPAGLGMLVLLAGATVLLAARRRSRA